MLPRLVLEVHRAGTICVVSNTPDFYLPDGSLDVGGLRRYTETVLNDSKFLGFFFVTLFESEDRVNTLEVYPHVFAQRANVYRPDDLRLVEMCALLSMAENMEAVSLTSVRAIMARLRSLRSKTRSEDGLFLLHGGRVLLSTLVRCHGLVEAEATPGGEWGAGLVLYRLHGELGRMRCPEGGLLKSIYLDSGRTLVPDPEAPPLAVADGGAVSMSLFYRHTLLTRHLQNPSVVSLIRKAVLTAAAELDEERREDGAVGV